MSGQPVSSEVSGSKPLVLVVDDEPLVRTVVARTLEAEGFQTMSVQDGVAARDLISTGTSPDLVLTDIMMPRMNGAELGLLLGKLRPGLPVVYMSGYGSDATHLLSPDILKNCFIAKPFLPPDLMTIIKRCLKTPTSTQAR